MAFEGMGNSSIIYSLVPDGDKTKLTWEMHSHLGFPYNLMKFFFKYSVSKAYNMSFDNIEVLLEERKKGVYGGYAVDEVLMKEKNYLMNRDEVALANIQQFYTRNLGAIFQKIQNEGLVMDGKPSGLFFKYDENKGVTDMASAIPLMESVSMEGLSSYNIPAGPALNIDYYGDYAKTGSAHVALENYMQDRNYLVNPPSVEEYVTDPLEVKDPTKWLTQIRYYYSSTNN
jgi:effector-binding domain-containing protein